MKVLTGNTVTLAVQFSNQVGAVYDPDTVTLKYKPAGGASVTLVHGTDPELEKDSVGLYKAKVTTTDPGRWMYRWEGEGPSPGNCATQGDFTVEASNL